MSTELFRKYIDIINENEQINELSPDLMRRAADTADAKLDSLRGTGPAGKDAKVKAFNQSEKFYQGQIDRSERNPAAGNVATFNAYKQKLEKAGWAPVTDPAQAQQILTRLDITDPGSIAYTTPTGEVAGLSPNGSLERTRGTFQGGQGFGSKMHPSVSADRKWNPNYADQDMFDPKSSF